MNIEERITRIEDALWFIAVMLTNGNPTLAPEYEDTWAQNSAWSFLQAVQDMQAER